MNPLGNYFWSLYFLKPSQIWWRLHRLMKDRAARWGFRFHRPIPELPPVSADFPRVTSRIGCGDIDLVHRGFQFLRDAASLPESAAAAKGVVSGKPLLWQFHFHYHDYLYSLLQRSDGGDTRAAVCAAIREWIDSYPADARDARAASWHAYVLSIRIEMWIRMLTEFSDAFPGDLWIAMRRSLYRQARTLRRNVERGTLANHLLRNIKALAFAGRYFGTAESQRWLDGSIGMLERELREQILDDGCHFERSPMYHVGILSDLCDLLELLRGTNGSAAASTTISLSRAIEKMAAFASHILHPDGEYPFFNDAASSETLETQEVLHRAERLISPTERHGESIPEPVGMSEDPRRFSGIHISRGEKLFVAFDAGNVGPDYQPGHAHADTLSFESSWRGVRWIVDTGVFHYRPGAERTYARSTPAHNTVHVNGRDQSDVWHSFRVGKRARIVAREVSRTERSALFQAAHDGYAPLIHERALCAIDDRCIIVADWFHGGSGHSLESFFHFHPDVRIDPDGSGAIASREGENCRILPLDPASKLSILSTPYYPAFGVALDRRSIRIDYPTPTPRLAGFLLLFAGPIPSFRLDQKDKKLQIQIDSRFEFQLRPLI